MSKGATAKTPGFELLLREPSPGGFILAEGSTEELYESLADRFTMTRTVIPKHLLTFYDTFDGRLHQRRAELWLSRRDRGYELAWRRGDAGATERLPVARRPAFADDLPAGPLHEELEKICKIRRLLPLAELELRGELWCVLDDEEKTVVRWLVEEGRVREPGESEQHALASVLRWLPVRGYDSRPVVAFLEEQLGRPLSRVPGLSRILAGLGKTPGDQAPSLRVDLSPSERADGALRAIGKPLLATVEVNEDGTRRDLDIEFLHDFRVAVRRTRSLLSQLKNVFEPAVLTPLRDELKWLGGVTGPTRDLDVFRHKLPRHRPRLPAHVWDELGSLADFLTAEQRREQRRMVRQLKGGRYRQLIESWRGFLELSGSAATAAAGPEAERPIAELAAEKIWRAYRKVRRRGRRIDDNTPMSALHALRIDCKKLRYLLELFRGLFDTAEMATSIKALKVLQDHLGDLNDLGVQQAELCSYAGRMLATGKASVVTVMAMGRLQGLLEDDEQAERRHFAERFGEFAHPDNHQRFKALFKASERPR